MCTLSWRRSPSHTLILFNRDESIDRGPESPLSEKLIGTTKIACPSDSDAGGTWIGINEHGCALALLNHYPQDVELPSIRRSRGQLLLDLLDLPKAQDLDQRIKSMDLSPYPPFRLVALNLAHARQARWDRSELYLNTPLPPLGSSSLDDVAIPSARAQRFKELPDSDEALKGFHSSHLPEKGAWSTCMHRSQARSCSFTQIVLQKNKATIEHTSLPPCEVRPELGKTLSFSFSSSDT